MKMSLSGGGLLLTALRKAGIDRFFINSGTEYVSLLLDYQSLDRVERPDMVVCLTENTAVSAAYGYYLGSGKPAAVLVHTVPGLLCGLPNVFNARSADVPLLYISGLTSFSSKGYAGSRKIRVHWGQDVHDVEGAVREFVKWHYVVKTVDEIPEAVMRAVEIASSKPEGPVYIGVHREWLLERPQIKHSVRSVAVSPPPSPSPDDVKRIAEKMVQSEFPVVLTRTAGRDRRAFHLLTELAEKICLRVNHAVGDYVNISNINIFSAKFDIEEADFVLVLDTDVPWLPAEKWPSDVYRVSVGPDPLKTRLNIWGYDFDEVITSDSAIFLNMLHHVLHQSKPSSELLNDRRESAKESWNQQQRERMEKVEVDLGRRKMTKRLASYLLGKALQPGSVVVNEYPLRPSYLVFDRPGTYYGEPPAGSLGWGLGVGLGVKMASPQSFVAVVLGDGSFVFNNPVSAAAMSRWYRLPVLLVVFNDGCWGDVKKSVSDAGPTPEEIGFLEGVDFPEKLDVHSIGKGLGLSSFLVESPDSASDVFSRAVSEVEKGFSALVDVRVTADF
ncbi:MAG: thiamine pyrophosphate-requiring protein [Candidatus Caldarchaeum sp.]|nr:thiamine pyrophosphate-requiring protein [Candidatus Caldarchaeum sp.]